MGTLVPKNTGIPPRMPEFVLIAWALIDLTLAVPFTRCVEDNYVRSENVGHHGAASASVVSDRSIFWTRSFMCSSRHVAVISPVNAR